MKPSVRVRAFAKINVGLKILGRRPDSYHEIRTVYQTVALHDRLAVCLVESGMGVRVECDDPAVPQGRRNLVHRACELWKQQRKFPCGIRVRLEKKIPAGSGLGGASSDAAATLLALEHLTGEALRPAFRFELAARLGSDVPFFLWGGRALGCGRGEEIYPLCDLPERCCLVVFPGFPVSTAEAYGQADRSLGLRLTKSGRGSRIDFLGARPQLSQENWEPAENDFERVIFAKWPELARAKSQLIRAGAKIASLTGSGSALYAVFDSTRELIHASKLIPAGWRLFRTRTVPRLEYERRIFVR